MLSPAMETFRGGGKARVFAVVLGLVFALGAWLAYQDESGFGTVGWSITLALAAAVAWVFYWISSVRVSMHAEGIAYESCLGTKEMRWDEVEKFYYSATRQSVNFIPVGTYYSLKLVGKDRKKLSFGNSIERPADCGARLIELTGKPLFERLAEHYNNGAELDFGLIKLSREHGFRLRRFFRWQNLPLDQLAEYRIEGGHLYLFKIGQKHATGFPIKEIPNAFVLLALLNSLYQPAA